MLDEETNVKRTNPNMHLDRGMTSLKAPVVLGPTKPELVESG